MTEIPFTKAHGAKNDFLLTWRKDAQVPDLPAFAKAICDRYTGVGADGWMLVDPAPACTIELYNSDGSKPEISGNGTRCAAAFLLRALGKKAPDQLTIQTGAGPKHLKLLRRNGPEYWFEMEMGTPVTVEERFPLEVAGELHDVTLLNVGNPQCVVPVDNFDFDWRSMGREIEQHAYFPNRINVSFIRRVDQHTIDVRFYERGAGETMSSGTGSTGAFAAAVLRGLVVSPVRVLTPAGPLELRWEGSIFLTGPAVLTVDGTFHYESIE
jgi:diaminopimelate epimerase